MFKKVKTEHHILTDLHKILIDIEKHPAISRIIPGRISRQQKWSSKLTFKISYPTTSGIKCIMCKWATAQELFVICDKQSLQKVEDFIQQTIKSWI